MISTIAGMSFFIIFLTLPVFTMLWKPGSTRSTLCKSIGLALALMALLSAVLSLIGTIAIGIFACISLAIVTKKLKQIGRSGFLLRLKRELIAVVPDIILGLVLGLAASSVLFQNISGQYMLSNDLWWNIGIIVDLQKNAVPFDPHWHENTMFRYHLLTNMYISGFSTIMDLHPIETTAKIIPTFVWTLIGIQISLILKRRIDLAVIVLGLMCTVWNRDYSLTRVFYRQISEVLASSFFWSLPIFTSCFMFVLETFPKRRNCIEKQIDFRGFLRASIPVYLTLPLIMFTKGSLAPVWIFFDFFFALCVLARRGLASRQFKSSMRMPMVGVLFLPLPLIFSAIYLLYFKQPWPTAEFQLVSHEFMVFDPSGFPKAAWLSIAPIALATILCSRLRSSLSVIIVALAFSNLCLFRFLKIAGNSDLYFGFNSLLMIPALWLSRRRPKPKTALFIGAVSFGSMFVVSGAKLTELTPPADWYKRQTGISAYDQRVADLRRFAFKVGKADTAITSFAKCREYFTAAALGARMWADCHHFTAEYNYYVNSLSLPKNKANSKFSWRYQLVERFLFEEKDAIWCLAESRKNGWKWAVVTNTDYRRAITDGCLSHFDKIDSGTHFTLVSLGGH